MKTLRLLLRSLYADTIGRLACALDRHEWRFIRPKRLLSDECFDLCIRCGRLTPPRDVPASRFVDSYRGQQ